MVEHAKVVSILRYPVKSMMGEEMNGCDVTSQGLHGDRAYAIVDTATGMLANAKNPKKWPNMFDYRAAFVEPPQQSRQLPAVRITLPDGSMAVSTEADVSERLSASFNRNVELATVTAQDVQFEGYVPDIEELDDRDTIFTDTTPNGTFFDVAVVHLLTTATLNQMQENSPESRMESRRFRPNLVIDVPNAKGFVENDWIGKVIRFGSEVRLHILEPTVRCIMTTLEQGDIPKDLKVLKTAVKHNKGVVGVYAAVLQGGRIRRGDELVFEE